MSRFFIVAIFATALIGMAAEPQVLELKQKSDWAAPARGIALVADGEWEITGPVDLAGARSFKVNPEKPVTISFDIKKSAENLRPLVYIGFWPMDADRIRIQPFHVRCEAGGDTELLEAAPAGATSLKLKAIRRKHSASWKHLAVGTIKGCPVPQFDLIEMKSLAKLDDNTLEATLAKPLEKELAAGTALHFHGNGPGMYAAYDAKTPGDEWATVTCTVIGMQEGFPAKDARWWKGTVYAKPRILVSQGRKDKVQLRNLRIEIEK